MLNKAYFGQVIAYAHFLVLLRLHKIKDYLMSNDVITVGSKTTTGGSVISGHGGVIINGQKVALVGDTATCPCGSKSCSGQGPIVAQSSRAANVFGTNLARVGDLVDTGCGSCFLDASSHQVSLNTSTENNLNMGSGVNIGNGVNINGGSVTFSSNSEPSNVIKNISQDFDEHFILRDKKTSKNVSNFAYKINTSSGSVEGKTASDGKTKLVSEDKEDISELDYVFQTKIGIE